MPVRGRWSSFEELLVYLQVRQPYLRKALALWPEADPENVLDWTNDEMEAFVTQTGMKDVETRNAFKHNLRAIQQQEKRGAWKLRTMKVSDKKADTGEQ